MQLHPIEIYLQDGGSFDEGIVLFEKYGGNTFLIPTFRKVQNDQTREMLEEQLQTLIPDKPIIKGAAEKFSIKSTEHHGSLPTAVRALNAQKADYFKEMSHLHSLLTEYDEIKPGAGNEIIVKFKNFETPEAADNAAFRIDELDKAINKIWDDLDYYEKNGKLPEVKEFVLKETNPVNLHKRLTTLRTYISRDPLSSKAGEWKTELDAITRRLES